MTELPAGMTPTLGSTAELSVSTTSFEVKEQVRQSTDIVEVVGNYLPLRRQGRNYVALCPWHEDRRPSFQVNPERQTFRCWVCDIGGDVFSFVMRREGIDFPAALEMLADRAGIQINRSPGAGAARDRKQQLFQAMEWAQDQFHRCLVQDPAAESARNYLAERSVTNDSIERFRIGYSPDAWRWLLDRSHTTEFSTDLLESAGLILESQKGGSHYDRFRGRVLFPIRDTQSRTIAFGGRVLPGAGDEQGAKYINSPESPLFAKNRELYGLDVARDVISKERHVIVTEGYTDCIMAQQMGVSNVVAVLGTALGESHLPVLKRYADRVTLVLDGDEAGQRRANEVLQLFVATPIDLRILTLPADDDPCSFLETHGAEAFTAAVDSAPDALEHKLLLATRDIDPASGSHQANIALEEVLGILAKARQGNAAAGTQTQMRAEQFLARVARTFQVPEQQLRTRIKSLHSEVRQVTFDPSEAEPEPAGAPIAIDDSWERELLELLLLVPEAIAATAEVITPEDMQSETSRRLLSTIVQLTRDGQSADLHRLLDTFGQPQMQSLLVRLDEQGRKRIEDAGVDPEVIIRDLVDSFGRRRLDRKQRKTVTGLREKRFDEKEEIDKLQELLEAEKSRHGISDSTDG